MLANVAALPPERVALLADWVKHGGGILIAPGDRVDPEAYDKTMLPLMPQSLRDPIDTTWNTSSTSIYPTYFKGFTSKDSLGHCAGCHLPGGMGAGKWSYTKDDGSTFYDALATIARELAVGDPPNPALKIGRAHV